MTRATAWPLWLSAGALLCLAAGPSPTVTPTPTPRPRLSGGFGRTAVTPAPSEQNGQSMADVVHAAGTAKAPKDKKSSVTIDNTNLVTDPNKGRLTTAGSQPAPRPTPAAAAGARPPVMMPPSPTPTLPPPGQPSADEQKWREASRAARQRVEDAKKRVEDLEASNHKLENDFYAWDDGQYRDRVIKPAWDKAKTDLEAARQELAASEKDLAALPEKARKAGALPGWLRE
jgi:hypothetical protein